MRVLTFLLFLQAAVPPQREIIGPYTFREDQGQTTKVILKNGLTIIVREEHAVPLVSITTYVKAGSFNEEDRVIGVSQVIDHLMFNGKPSEDMRSLGGILSLKTYGDRTIYNSVVPAANATAALAIQSSVLRHTAFESADVQRGIERVLQENITQQDSPSNVA